MRPGFLVPLGLTILKFEREKVEVTRWQNLTGLYIGDVVTLVPVPVSALVPEKNYMFVARGAPAPAAATGGAEASDSFGPL